MKNLSINFDNVLDGLFSDRELEVLNCFKEHTVDLQKLKTLGDVEELVEDINGVITRVINFVSKDKTQSYSRVYTYENANIISKDLARLDLKLKHCIENEDYLEAFKIKQEKIKLLEKTNV